MTKIITVYRKYDNTIVVKVHKALHLTLSRYEENNLKDAVREALVVTKKELKYATKYKRVGT